MLMDFITNITQEWHWINFLLININEIRGSVIGLVGIIISINDIIIQHFAILKIVYTIFLRCHSYSLCWLCHWRIETARSSIAHGLVSKLIPNLSIWWKYLELRGIMVNISRIHRELGKFLMISSNLIKSDNELMIEIGENDILWKRTSRWFHRIKNHQIWLWFCGEIEDRSEMKFSKIGSTKILKLKMKLIKITNLNGN